MSKFDDGKELVNPVSFFFLFGRLVPSICCEFLYSLFKKQLACFAIYKKVLIKFWNKNNTFRDPFGKKEKKKVTLKNKKGHRVTREQK